MGRTITLFSACWVYSVPLLCTSGLIVHPCDCESPNGCDHETECSDDPCNATAIVPNGSTLRAFDFCELVAAPLDHAPLIAVDAMLCSFSLRQSKPPGQYHRPFADGDLPLLI